MNNTFGLEPVESVSPIGHVRAQKKSTEDVKLLPTLDERQRHFHCTILPVSVVHNGELYVFGGYNGLHDLHFNDLYKFDPSKSWFIAARMFPKHDEHALGFMWTICRCLYLMSFWSAIVARLNLWLKSLSVTLSTIVS